MLKKILATLLAMFLLVGCIGCAKNSIPPDDTSDKDNIDEGEEEGIDLSKLMPVAIFTMDDGQVFEIELYREVAPVSVNNFIKLIRKGFYNGTLIHRITVSGIYVIQGGGYFLDEDNKSFSKPADNIVGEFYANGFINNLSHEEGVISMARANAYNSASSQFFICYNNSSSIDGDYATFGRVRSGLDVVKEIAKVPIGKDDAPINDIVIKTVKLKYVQY
jgi:peptidyl-prolyl cis-trans isomerase B (cyclophilin B)